MFKYRNSDGDFLIGKIVAHIVLAFIVIVFVFGSFGTVSYGNRGVLIRMSAVTGKVFGEGFYFKLPLLDHVVEVNVQNMKEQVNASAASKDLQTVNSAIALNYKLDEDKVAIVYQTVGANYKSVIIDPAIQESVKASTARFTAEELITKRQEVSDDIKSHLTARLQGTGVHVIEFSVIDFDFSKSFNDAIEAKVTAEQNALASKNKLEQVKYEAQQAVESAGGRAEALRVEAKAIEQNPQVLQLRAIEKWNGVLPQVTGSSMPFVNIK